MKILIASDSFKGCMSSKEANWAMEKGILKADSHLQTECFPISDGGEGMVEAFIAAYEARRFKMATQDLYGVPITVDWALDEKTGTACVEAASCVGLTLYPPEIRYPMNTSSYGLGLLVKKVLARSDVKRIIIGLGGTGSNDGGIGFIAAFGAGFYDRQRCPLDPCTRNLNRIAYIEKRTFHYNTRKPIIAACDVSNPLLGEKGATYVFGRQKGLIPALQREVEVGMENLNRKVIQTFHVDMNRLKGSGAAGGLGGMILGIFGATMLSGIDVLEKGGLFQKIQEADYVFTGEGQTDAQTIHGKAVAQIAHLCKRADVPLICICGGMLPGAELLYHEGVSAIFSSADRAMSFSYALSHGPEKVEKQAYNVTRLILAAERRKRK